MRREFGLRADKGSTIMIVETERLMIRKFNSDDLNKLYSIMNKIEVMYAWEKAFSKNETEEWINRQLKRYDEDGYGYFAVILKETKELIGQVGLMKSEIKNKKVVEIGYIFDNNYWKKGYCIESINECINYAFETLNIQELYATIRPENKSSIKIIEKIEKIGMRKIDSYIKRYDNKEIEHYVYKLENNIQMTEHEILKEEKRQKEALCHDRLTKKHCWN
jgi:RimJ/RimL family protein N-acetyltransferase